MENSWHTIKTENDVESLIEKSTSKPQIIFKHSVRCGVSAHINEILEEATTNLGVHADFNYLDLLRYRSVSNFIRDKFKVTHQSPQVIVVKDKKVILSASHYSINEDKILKSINK